MAKKHTPPPEDTDTASSAEESAAIRDEVPFEIMTPEGSISNEPKEGSYPLESAPGTVAYFEGDTAVSAGSDVDPQTAQDTIADAPETEAPEPVIPEIIPPLGDEAPEPAEGGFPMNDYRMVFLDFSDDSPEAKAICAFREAAEQARDHGWNAEQTFIQGFLPRLPEFRLQLSALEEKP